MGVLLGTYVACYFVAGGVIVYLVTTTCWNNRFVPGDYWYGILEHLVLLEHTFEIPIHLHVFAGAVGTYELE